MLPEFESSIAFAGCLTSPRRDEDEDLDDTESEEDELDELEDELIDLDDEYDESDDDDRHRPGPGKFEE